MSATQHDGIQGRAKAEWTPSRDAYLVDLLIELHNCGRTAYNEFKNEVIKSVTRDFNMKFGMNLEENQIKNRYNVMKKDYGVVKTLLSQTGFRWDETRKMVVADDNVWDRYIAVRTEARPFRRKSFPLYKPMSVIFEGERATSKPIMSSVPVLAEEGHSNTETMQYSEPRKTPTQLIDGTPDVDSDSIIRINQSSPKKRKSVAPKPCCHRKKAADSRVSETIENVIYEMLTAAATYKSIERNTMTEHKMYQKCLEDLQKLEELDDLEFAKAVNVLKDDKNQVAFVTIKGPRRLVWLRSLWQEK